MNYDIEYGL